MKTRLRVTVGRCYCLGAFLCPAALIMLAALDSKADTSFTNTSYLYDVPVPGTLVTNALGQVQLKGNVHMLAVQGSEPRVTGRMQGNMDVAYQADGTSLASGPAYFEVGTWQDQTNFIPTGGIWLMNWRGVGQADNSSQMTMTGYGIGGNINGLRVEASVTRGPGPYPDPTIPYFASGMIKPAPTILTNAINLSDATNWNGNLGPQGWFMVTNNQLTMHTTWPVATHYIADTTAWKSPARAASVTGGHTLETRVDLVALDGPGAAAVLAIYNADGLGYWLSVGDGAISLGRQTSFGMTFFRSETLDTGTSNKVLTLAVTPSGNRNVLLTARVLDPANNGAADKVLTCIDTPASDPSLTAAQVEQITGMKLLGIVYDPAGSPGTVFQSPWLGLFQYTDGTLPAAEVTFANFQLRTYDVPPVSISRAVQISVPCAEGMNYCLESAPTPNGPWSPVNVQTPAGMQTFTIPAVKGAEFFQPQSAP